MLIFEMMNRVTEMHCTNINAGADVSLCSTRSVLTVAGMHRDEHVVGLDVELGAFHSQGVVRETQLEKLAGVALQSQVSWELGD